MTEYLDLIDLNNQVIGKTTKIDSHCDGSPHRVVAIFIFNEKGELLINRRKDNGLLDQSVGGHILAGEDPDIAAVREAREEVGLIDAASIKPIGNYLLDETSRGNNIFHWFYLYEAKVNNFNPVIQTKEVVEVFWKPLNEIYQEVEKNPQFFSLGFIGNLNYYLKNLK